MYERALSVITKTFQRVYMYNCDNLCIIHTDTPTCICVYERNLAIIETAHLAYAPSRFLCNKKKTCEHTRTHTYNTHTHTLSLSLTHTHTLSLSLTRTHTLSLSHTHTHTHTLSLSLSHARTRTHSLSHAHTQCTYASCGN